MRFKSVREALEYAKANNLNIEWPDPTQAILRDCEIGEELTLTVIGFSTKPYIYLFNNERIEETHVHVLTEESIRFRFPEIYQGDIDNGTIVRVEVKEFLNECGSRMRYAQFLEVVTD